MRIVSWRSGIVGVVVSCALACLGCGAAADTSGLSSRDWKVFTDHDFGISIRYPGKWHVTHDSLTDVVWPPQILAVASYPLSQVKPDPDCAPITAGRAMPEDGAFIYVFEMTGAPLLSDASLDEFPPRPEHFTLGKPVNYECFGLTHRVGFRERDRLFQSIVALGSKTSAETQETAVQVLRPA